jgi:hypothetical protein
VLPSFPFPLKLSFLTLSYFTPHLILPYLTSHLILLYFFVPPGPFLTLTLDWAGGRDRVQPAAQGGELLDGPPAHGARERARGGLRQGRIARGTSRPSRGIQFSSVTSSQGINIKPR